MWGLRDRLSCKWCMEWDWAGLIIFGKYGMMENGRSGVCVCFKNGGWGCWHSSQMLYVFWDQFSETSSQLGEEFSGTGLFGRSLDILPNLDMWTQPHSQGDMDHSFGISLVVHSLDHRIQEDSFCTFFILVFVLILSNLYRWYMNAFSYLSEFHCCGFQNMLVCYLLILLTYTYNTILILFYFLIYIREEGREG